MTRAVFPGSFDPLTLAHLGIAEAARDQLDVTEVDLVISTVALAKDPAAQPPAWRRVGEIRRIIEDRAWLDVRTTDQQLLVDIAEGYDVVIIGADKWHQLVDPSFYDDSPAARDRAVARLPLVAVAPREGFHVPASADVVHLTVPRHLRAVSSTAVRNGRSDWRA